MTKILTPREAEALDNHAEQQARAQLSCIRDMLAAVSLDWERLEELRTERADLAERLEECEAAYAYHDSDNTKTTPEWVELKDAREALAEWDNDNTEELCDLEHSAGDYESQEEAEQAIYENPLSIEYRSGWASSREEMQPEEFQILLCTGGPAVRIMGELNWDGQPDRAWFEYQDWGTPWTMLFEGQADAWDFANRLIQP